MGKTTDSKTHTSKGVDIIGKRQNKGSKPMAIRNLTSQDPQQQLKAIQTLTRTMPHDAIEPLVLVATSEDTDWVVMEKCRDLLWKYGPPVVSFIKSRLKKTRKELPISLALGILGRIGSTEAVEAILRYVGGSGDRCERLGSVEALMTHFGLYGNNVTVRSGTY